VAGALGNTKSVCRKCYIHPEILESYLEGELSDFMQRQGRSKAAEKAVAALLKARSRRAVGATKRSGAEGRSLVPALARSLSHRARRLQQHPQPIARGAP
jgi:DNA topoisomerase-1